MKFDETVTQDNAKWTSISGIILSKNNKLFDQTISGFRKIKKTEIRSKNVSFDFTSRFSKGFTTRHNKKFARYYKPKLSQVKRLHNDSLLDKIVNLKIQKSNPTRYKRPIDGGRRYSKVSTHEPSGIEQLLYSRNANATENEQMSVNGDDLKILINKLETESSKFQSSQASNDVNFKINIEKASNKSEESVKIFTNQAEVDVALVGLIIKNL